MNTLGERIKNSRAKKLLSQRELAKRANVSLSLVGQLETGLRNGTPKTLYAIAKALDVSPEWLMTGDKDLANEENRYKVQLDHVLKLTDFLENPRNERKILNDCAHLAMALTELQRVMDEDAAEGQELERLGRMEMFAKLCCGYFKDLRDDGPEDCERVKERFYEWRQDKQEFDELLDAYLKLNQTGKRVLVDAAFAMTASPATAKQ